jgi:hypothetical protein
LQLHFCEALVYEGVANLDTLIRRKPLIDEFFQLIETAIAYFKLKSMEHHTVSNLHASQTSFLSTVSIDSLVRPHWQPVGTINSNERIGFGLG